MATHAHVPSFHPKCPHGAGGNGRVLFCILCEREESYSMLAEFMSTISVIAAIPRLPPDRLAAVGAIAVIQVMAQLKDEMAWEK